MAESFHPPWAMQEHRPGATLDMRRIRMTPAHLELLRRLALSDESTISTVMAGRLVEPRLLDAKTASLVRIAGLVAMESGSSSYQSAVDAAHAAGAEDDEIIEVLIAVAPIIGTAMVDMAAPSLMAAVGHDLD